MIRVFIVFILLGNSICSASNKVQELEYIEKIEANFLPSAMGRIVWLKAKDSKFLALYTETEKKENSSTAIILHGIGKHADDGRLINPLRTYLPQHNWATLSLQMPTLNKNEKQEAYYYLFDEANSRIQAAVDYLVSADTKNIVLIGDGIGGMMGTYYLNKNADTYVKAMVAVSLNVPKSEHQNAQVIDFISKINQPFLDVYTEHDPSEVTGSARKRRIAGKNSLAYRQFKIQGEGHKRSHDEGLLVKRIYSWINSVFR